MLAESLRKKVRSLPKNMRMVILLRFQEDLKLAEIADTLDMPLNTVKDDAPQGATTVEGEGARVEGGGSVWNQSSLNSGRPCRGGHRPRA